MRLSILLAVLPLAFAAPIITPRAGQVILGKYIIKLKNDALQALVSEALDLLDGEPEHKWDFGGFKGFGAKISDELVEKIAALPGVSVHYG